MSETSTRRSSFPEPLQYAAALLDRAAHLREDAGAIDAALADPGSALIPFWRGRNLVQRDAGSGPAAARIPVEHVDHAREVVFLGRDGGQALFAVDFSHLEDDRLAALARGEFVELRHVGPALSAADADVLAYARGMLEWHRSHRYCGQCGAPTSSVHGGHRRVCTNDECRRIGFPRTDPAMIVLVLHPDETRCLLGRARRWPERAYSTLAGFIEPGECLEAAVRREVFEEAGVRVGEVRYLGSQPWPFPASLMVGFHAVAETTSIKRHDGELVDARWFDLDEVAAAGEWDGDEAVCLPRPDSIARALIEAWLARFGP